MTTTPGTMTAWPSLRPVCRSARTGTGSALQTPSLTPGRAVEFRFRILGPDGAPVTAYTPTHEKDLHLIVVRRDLSGFQHVHPTLGADGVWCVPLTVAAAGQYRVFADFQPAGRDRGADPRRRRAGRRRLPARGRCRAGPHRHGRRLHRRARRATSCPARVEPADPDASAGTARPVTDLQPYLGAYGHLVALRDGDLAYLHVHPDGAPATAAPPAGPEITFHAEVPSAGDLPAVPRLPARRHGAHRGVHRVAGRQRRPPAPTPSPADTAGTTTRHGTSGGTDEHRRPLRPAATRSSWRSAA